MATIINNPGSTESSGSGMGLILGIVIAILLIGIAFWVFGRPMFYGGAPQTQNNTDQQQNQDQPQDGEKKIEVEGEVKY